MLLTLRTLQLFDLFNMMIELKNDKNIIVSHHFMMPHIDVDSRTISLEDDKYIVFMSSRLFGSF